jgi:hypothetical protein
VAPNWHGGPSRREAVEALSPAEREIWRRQEFEELEERRRRERRTA